MELQALIDAANSGNINASLTLGHMYEEGDGVERSLTEALRYYEKAAYNDNEEGAYHAALIHKMSLENKPENPLFATMMLSYGANVGSARCHGLLAEHYINGYGTKQSYVLALKSAKIAAEAGDLYGQYVLGLLTLTGKATEQDENRGLALMKTSAYAGLTEAKYALGICYEFGIGTEKALFMAQDWYLQAKNEGHVGAHYRVSRFSQDEEAVDKVELPVFFQSFVEKDGPLSEEDMAKLNRPKKVFSSFDEWFNSFE